MVIEIAIIANIRGDQDAKEHDTGRKTTEN